MARLIDADLLMEKLNVFNDREHGNEHFINGIETAKELLEDMPTAYDVEKVASYFDEEAKKKEEQAEIQGNFVDNAVMKFRAKECTKYAEIVRKGGVE